MAAMKTKAIGSQLKKQFVCPRRDTADWPRFLRSVHLPWH
jgi:hypothetical protein